MAPSTPQPISDGDFTPGEENWLRMQVVVTAQDLARAAILPLEVNIAEYEHPELHEHPVTNAWQIKYILGQKSN